jgi:hypothetical protein
MECKHCKNTFKNISSLNVHQKTTKYCLKLQNVQITEYECKCCTKSFTRIYDLDRHQKICKAGSVISDNVIIIETLEKTIDKLTVISNNYKEKYLDLLKDTNELKQSYECKIERLQDRIENIAIQAVSNGCSDNNEYETQNYDIGRIDEDSADIKLSKRIEFLEKKYLKKQPRLKIKEKNVIYILTTNSLQKERRYIFGKAHDLTNRLSTYNKSDEHKIVYYASCLDEDAMSVAETLVFQKLKIYREQANRERFILPKDKEIQMFVNIVKECVDFVS